MANDRSCLLKKNILASFAIKGWAGIIQLLLVPITIHCLGNYINGLWMVISSVLIWIDSLDIGLGNGLRNKLSERIASEVVAFHDAVELGVFFFQPHDARACEHDFQFGVVVVAVAQLLAPVGFLEHLVDEQHFAAVLVELAGKVGNTAPLEVEVVHVHVEALAVAHIEILLGVLQKECGFSYAPRTFDANHTVAPVDFVHKASTNWCVSMLHKIRVCAKESFH